MSPPTILDTGPLVALLNRRDRHHDWVVQTLAGLAAPLWTCEPVLAEASHLTREPARIMRMVATGALRIGLDVAHEAEAIATLLDKYDGRMDLADACIVRMSELLKGSRVFTLDRRDFAVYRKSGRAVIPLLAPSR